MTGPSTAPRGERAGTQGARWETRIVPVGERVVPDDAPAPRVNRATRRAAARRTRSERTPPPVPTTPCPGPCRAGRCPEGRYLCHACWTGLAPAARRALARRDAQSRVRLCDLYDQLAASTPLSRISIR